ncbi:MAG: hypothetical protein AB7O88_05255 [Reyranellaceae bacterium]
MVISGIWWLTGFASLVVARRIPGLLRKRLPGVNPPMIQLIMPIPSASAACSCAHRFEAIACLANDPDCA